MRNFFRITYTLKCFESSSDQDFIKSINIYQKSVSRNVKTNTNEITWVIDHRNVFKTSYPYFFGLQLNNKVIGYAEVAYIKRTRFIILDYITIDDKYKTHSALFSFLLLILEYFNSIKLDYDFVGIEVLTDYEGNISNEEISEFELEGFKVINSLYIQPSLELNNYDSLHEAVLLINQRNNATTNISKETYCEIVHALYFDYYYEWDCKFINNDIDQAQEYNRLKENYEKVLSNCINANIILNGYPFKSISSENKVIPRDYSKNKNLWLSMFFIIIFSIVVLGIIPAIKKLNIDFVIVVAVFIILIVLWLVFLALFDDRALKILNKVPFVSKLIELLK